MKLPGFPSFIGKRKEHPEVFLSLLLYPDAVEAGIWELGPHGVPTILGAVTQDLSHDSWQERVHAADKCITTLEDIAHTTNLQKVILGLPAPYLTQDGDILKDIRPHIKKLTHELGLVPIGFVSIYQAIVHKHKKQEGIPPSLILLGFTAGSVSVSLYRVGKFVGQITIPKEGSIAEHLEDAFSQFSNSTVLPSRILIYGTKPAVLETAKRELLKHHWTARSNFIHFPKIEILSGDGAAIAVSFAGAGELTNTIDDVEEVKGEIEVPLDEQPVDEETIRVDAAEETEELVEEELEEELNEESVEEVEEEETSDEIEGLSEESADVIDEVTDEVTDESMDEQSNVIPVDPEALGFRADEEGEETGGKKASHHSRKKHFNFGQIIGKFKGKLSLLSRKPHQTQVNEEGISEKKGTFRFVLIGIPVALLLLGGYFVADTILPKATVKITTRPQTISQSETVSVDTDSTSISGTTIPGKKKEQSVSGDKTVSATGKKTVGDASKGQVTIINKSTVSKTFKKGTIVTTGGIDFSLDTDISIASASETFQGITYSKEKVSVTAKQIGTKGNISAGKDLTISGVSSTIATARNDEAFSGGTSKDVTVVARADQEAIVKELTAELTTKAKEEFEGTGGELLIPETIKTTVTEKVFSAEIGQDAKEVNGKITVTISGIGYAASDVSTLLRDKVKSQIPAGYVLSSDLPKVETGTPTVAKNGTITLSATISASSIPDLQLSTLAKEISGKNSSEAKKIITSHPGIEDVQFTINSILHKDRLPNRQQNITILVSNGS